MVLVDTEWLAAHLEDPSVVVVDMRWRGNGSGLTLYERGHVPGAPHLDWSRDIVDPHHPVAFMLAPPKRFAAAMERAGIGDDSLVVPYADEGGSGPFRLWWASRVYGHDNVRPLDGGWEKWTAEGRPVTVDRPSRRVVSWTPRESLEPSGAGVAGPEDVAAAVTDPACTVLDSRPAEQFRGAAVWFETGPVPAGADGIARTPRGDLRAGHVPGARNVPSSELYRPDGTMKSPDQLRKLLAAAGVHRGSRAITYCGVGISASALLFALRRAGIEDAALYDASWEEWGRDPARPVARD